MRKNPLIPILCAIIATLCALIATTGARADDDTLKFVREQAQDIVRTATRRNLGYKEMLLLTKEFTQKHELPPKIFEYAVMMETAIKKGLITPECAYNIKSPDKACEDRQVLVFMVHEKWVK